MYKSSQNPHQEMPHQVRHEEKDVRHEAKGKTLNHQTPHSGLDPEPPIGFPPSVQVDLFNYLKPQQREDLRPYLRLIKPQYQEKLCVSLLDYLEGHGLTTLSEPVLQMLQEHIVAVCRLRPLTSSRFKVQGSNEPKSLRTIIKQLFPGLIPSCAPHSVLDTESPQQKEMPHQVRHEEKTVRHEDKGKRHETTPHSGLEPESPSTINPNRSTLNL